MSVDLIRSVGVTHGIDNCPAIDIAEGLVSIPDNAGDFENPPDAACTLLTQDGTVRARCSIWWRRTPNYSGRRTGLIGQFYSADVKAGESLIRRACSELIAHGCEFAVGPMDGSTWDDYRFVVKQSATPQFFLEPHNHSDWPLQFLQAGFSVIARYRSALQTNIKLDDRRTGRILQLFGASGISIRCIVARSFEEELERIHSLVMAGFRDSLFFTPINAEEFVRRHRRLRPAIREDLVLIAERAKRPIALFFAIPDLMQLQRGEPIDTAIIKTIVALPGRANAGIAHLLAARAAAIAHEAGYRQAIHALMRESIHSANWSARFGNTIRTYALFAKKLVP